YVPNDKYKSAHRIIQMLIQIVSRGGNLLLNIGPGPDGDWDPVAYERLKEIGEWMKINGEAIHGSKPLAPYESGNIHFTQAKDKKTQYAFYLSDKDNVALPAQVILQKFEAPAKARISLLGSGARLKWSVENGNTIIEIPSLVRNKWNAKHAVVFKIVR